MSAVVLAVSATAATAWAGSSGIGPGTRFYTPQPNPGATAQINRLKHAGKHAAARRLQSMVDVPQAVWFTQGTPAEVKQYAQQIVADADADASVPMLVAYNIPGRDCAEYSAGGAANGNAYRAWIDALVEGIGNTPAVVVIEPDGLSGLPTDCGMPDTYGRIDLISYAAHAFLADPAAQVYIDAGNSNWNPVGLTAARLVDAGVADVNGFALNTSGFEFTTNSNQYGTWVSDCITYGTAIDPGNFDACPDQYGSLGGVPLSPFGKWSDTASKAKFNTSNENERYAQLMGSHSPTSHFVVDTSRNGVGPWPGTSAHPASRANTETWCNPTDRGAGRLPDADTGVPLLDAYLWVKSPGESDGECYRWTNGPQDPYRQMRDPAAGVWFPKQARELADKAVPALP